LKEKIENKGVSEVENEKEDWSFWWKRCTEERIKPFKI
jgi:hypothetical protein